MKPLKATPVRTSKRPEAAEPPRISSGLVGALQSELEEAGRLETALGQAALALAVRIESGRETGAAVSALSREMRATLVEALKGAHAAKSKLSTYQDELAARRGARGA